MGKITYCAMLAATFAMSVSAKTYQNNETALSNLTDRILVTGYSDNFINNDICNNNITDSSMGGIITVNTVLLQKIINNRFINNTASSGSVIHNIKNDGTLAGNQIHYITGNVFSRNHATGNSSSPIHSGGAIRNESFIHQMSGNTFTANHSDASGGAIYHNGEYTKQKQYGIGVVAKDADTVFTGNTDSTGSNAIYNDGGLLNISSYENHKIIVNDGISGSSGNKDNILNINNGKTGYQGGITGASGLDFGVVAFNNKVQAQEIIVHDGKLSLGEYVNGGSDKNYHNELVANSVASLISSDVTVNKDATLEISANGVKVDSGSSLNINGMAEFDFGSSIVSDGDISFGENAKICFDLTEMPKGGGSFVFLQDSDQADGIFDNLQSGNMTVVFEKKGRSVEYEYIQNPIGELGKNQFTINKLAGGQLELAIPEPATIGLLGLVTGGMLFIRRRFLI